MLVPAGVSEGTKENWLRGAPDTRPYVRRFGGREIRFDQLDVASRVRVWYDLKAATATRVLVLPGESLSSRAADALLSLAFQGEARGGVPGVNLNSVPPVVTVQDEVSGMDLVLSVTPNSNITMESVSMEMSSLSGTSVAVSYDPGSLSIIELEELTPAAYEKTVMAWYTASFPRFCQVISPS